MKMNPDNINQRLLGMLQREFPLVREPFAELGERLGISEEEVIRRIAELKETGIVRQISPVLDARRLGYRTTLVAMRVAPELLEKAAQTLQEHPRVSHGYEREHPFNLWFTLAAPGTDSIEAEIRQMADAIPAEAAFNLPATKLYKIGAYFGNGAGEAEIPAKGDLPQAAPLSAQDKAVINASQADLPLISHPFGEMAQNANIAEAEFLAQCRSLRERGIMRRYGAAVNHRRAGFTANAMTCWAVPQEKVDAVGERLAALREVSHCYERKTSPQWRHNLFAMIHGRSRENCAGIARQVSDECNLSDCVTLFSTKELKKTRVKYLV